MRNPASRLGKNMGEAWPLLPPPAGLVILSLVAVALFRFVVPVRILEALAWAALVFLQAYSHLTPRRSMYEAHWWRTTVGGQGRGARGVGRG